MSKCFITKLPSSVDNDNLPVLGQLRIKWLKQDSLKDNDARFVALQTNDSIIVKVSGAHFTDNTLASNIGNTKIITAADGDVSLYVSNDADAVLTIDNKYSLTNLNFVKDYKDNLKRSVYFDIEDIKYCTNLISLNINNTQVSGDISAVRNLTNLTNMALYRTQVSGDISAVRNLTNLTSLEISSTQVSGDISAVRNLTNLTSLNIYYTQISGDISALRNLTNLTRLNIYYTQISGDISALSNLTNIQQLGDLKGLPLIGDMSKIHVNVYFISLLNRPINTNFTWTAKGRQNATLLAMEGSIPFDTASMDNMLIDQATCTLKSKDSEPWTKVISVSGTRTSASDAAVTAIQNMGVTITGVSKVS